MFLRKYWIPLSVFLVGIVGIGLYLLATQPRDTTAAVKGIEFSPNLTKEEYAKLKAINKDLESNIAERQKLRADMEKAGTETQEVYNQINALFDKPQRTAEDEAQIIALLNRAEELKAVVKRTSETCETLETTADTFVAEMRQIAKGEGVRKDE